MSSPTGSPPAPAARPRPAKASPWPFVGMAGLVSAFFPYAASGLVAPPWAVVVLLGIWLAMFVLACRWWSRHPKRLLGLAVFAVVLWFVLISAGGFFLDWTA